MSNQIVISSGAKVRSLEGVLTGSAGIVSSVPLGGANGVATLDSSGKVPLSQLPASVVTYLGTWNAATNTPTLANGTGDVGDLYICNVAGTVNFGAGPITFAVGDWVIYNGSEWQKSAGQNGTVTSVAVTSTGNDAISITGSPITTAGTINIGFTGDNTQYVNGAGDLTTFPTTINEAKRLVTEVYNETGATLTKGTVVYINGGHGNLPTITKAIATGDSTSAQTYGVVQTDITNNNNGYVVVIGSLMDLDTQAYPDGTQLYLSGTTAGAWTSTKPSAPIHLVYVGIVVRSHPTQGVVEVRIQNGYELEELHDVAISSPLNNQGIFYNSSTDLWENKSIDTALGYTPANAATYVPYTGATNSLYMGASYLVSAKAFITSGASGNGYLKLTNQSTAASPESDGVKLSSGMTADLVISSNTYNSTFATSANTANRTYTFPNASGTIALTSDIPSLSGYVPYTGATSNVDLGSHNLTTTGDLFVGSVTAGGIFAETNVGGEGYIYLKGNGTFGILSIYNSIFANGYKYGFDVQGGTTGAAKRAYLDFGSLTNSTTRTYSFPDASGTLALTSDIPSLTNYVTTNTLQTITGIKNFTNEQLFGNGIALTGGFISYEDSGFNLTLNTNTLTANRNIFLQDGSGTLAFTSDIPSLSSYVQGSGTTNYLSKFTASGTIGNSLVYDNGTTVAIGSTAYSGGAKLITYQTSSNTAECGIISYTTAGAMAYLADVTTGDIFRGDSTIAAVKSTKFRVTNTGYTTLANDIKLDNGAADGAQLVLASSGFSDWNIDNFSGNFRWYYNATERMRLSAAGNLGIGTNSPTSSTNYTALNINGTTGSEIYLNGSNVNYGYMYANSGGVVLASQTAIPLVFQTNATERMRISSDGRVAMSTTNTTYATLNVKASGTFLYNGIAIYSTDGTESFLGLGNSGSAVGLFATYGASGSYLPITFSTGGSERMRITSGGNVGIGTSSPSTKLDISAGEINLSDGYALRSSGELMVRRTGNEFRLGSGVSNDYTLFYSGGVEKMRLAASGQLVIGSSSVSNEGYLQVWRSNSFWNTELFHTYSTQYFQVFRYNSTAIGSIVGNGSTTSFNTTSDYRLKEDLKEVNGLEKISAIKIYDFKWKGTENRMHGVIAHELEEILPYAVFGQKDDLEKDGSIKAQSVDYSKLVPVLVKAIQELKSEIDELKNK